MEQSEPDHYVKWIHSVFKIKIDNIEKAKKRIGQSIYKKEFSPFPGFVFQIKLLNIDSNKFSVSLKNCGKTSVQRLIRSFAISNRTTRVDSSMNLLSSAVRTSFFPISVRTSFILILEMV